jgi:hypothetical protein
MEESITVVNGKTAISVETERNPHKFQELAK